jgi:hypothetical protein
MARFEEIVDLYFSDSGDFLLSTSGDLEDTKKDHYRGFLQRVLTRIQSRRGEWATQPSVGANLGQFVGKPNTEEIAGKIRQTISSELVQDGLLRGTEFGVDVFPISKTQIAIAIIVNPPRVGGQIVLTLTYDTRDNRLIPRNI